MSERSARHYLNGRWVSDDELKISPLDLAVLRGFGVFDFMTATKGRPFRLAEHLDRYERSAAQLQLDIPTSRHELEQIIATGIKRSNDIDDLFIRLVLTGGVSSDFISPGEPNFMVLFHPAVRPAPSLFVEGVKVITYPYSRELAEAKSLNYAAAVLAMKQAKECDASEAIYVDPETSCILEGTGSNIFFVKGGQLYTPGEHILKGVMRRTILELAHAGGIPVLETDIHLDDIVSFEECFITSAVKRILPVRQVDDSVNYGRVGPVTLKLQGLLKDYTER